MTDFDVEKIANIISRNTGVVMRRSTFWGVARDGNGWSLAYKPTDLLDLTEDAIIGVILHEAYHIKCDDGIMEYKFDKKILEYREQLHHLLCVLENNRIEYIASKDIPKAPLFFNKMFVEKEKDRDKPVFCGAHEFCEDIDISRFGKRLGIDSFSVKPDKKEFSDFHKDTSNAILLTKKYITSKTRKSRIEIILKIWEIYKKYLEKEPPQEEKEKKTVEVPELKRIPYDELKKLLRGVKKELKNKISQVRLEEAKTITRNKESGKLDIKKLYKAGFNNTTLFKKEHQIKKDYPEFSIWLDTSGSMSYHNKAYWAMAGSILLCETLQELNIPFTFGTFAKDSKIVKDHKSVFKKIHIEEIYNYFGGGTQDFKALRMAVKSFSGNKRNRIIIMITDGESEGKTQLRHTLNSVQRGHKVIALGINLRLENLNLYKHKIVTVPKDLPKKLLQILKREL